MAGNFGKFVDRSPIICAAGKPLGDPRGPTISSTLKEYSLEDQVTAIKHDANIWREHIFVPPLKPPPIKHSDFNRTNTEVKDLLNPLESTRYQTLLQDLKETTYSSYWNKELGRERDPIPGLPAGMSPLEVTFGKPSVKETSVKELINPSKTPEQVIQESEIGHELYKRSHNNFYESEKVQRGYNGHFDPTMKFGKKSNYDPRGMGIKCCVNWLTSEPTTIGSKFQADCLHRVKSEVGQILAPNHNEKCVPLGHVYGDRSERTCYGVEELLKDPNVKPCLYKRNLYKWLSILNKIKVLVKKAPMGTFSNFYGKALYFDKEKQGVLPLNEFYRICDCYDFGFGKKDLEPFLKLLNIIQDDKINYKQFADLINPNEATVELPQFEDIPKEYLHYTTTNKSADCDRYFIDNSNMPPAGIPSVRIDLPRPIIPPGGCRADLDHLGLETSVKALLNPNIFTTYGLTYRDFFMPRSSETLKSLFEKIGYSFPRDSFQMLWEEGLKIDETGMVCVNTFNQLVKKHFPPTKVAVDELECIKKHL